jgi:SAM-dependent methyltransferase
MTLRQRVALEVREVRRIWLRLKQSAGFLDLAGRCLRYFRRRLTDKKRMWPECREWDLLYGTDTATEVTQGRLVTNSPRISDAEPYQPTTPAQFERMLEHMTIDYPKFTFLDLGCGKGLALLLASRYRFNNIIGVDFSPVLCDIARKNVKVFEAKMPGGPVIKVIHADAVQYEFPEVPLCLYLFNPFGVSVMESVLQHLSASLAKSPRMCWIVYKNPILHQNIKDHGFNEIYRGEAYAIYCDGKALPYSQDIHLEANSSLSIT